MVSSNIIAPASVCPSPVVNEGRSTVVARPPWPLASSKMRSIADLLRPYCVTGRWGSSSLAGSRVIGPP